MAFTYSGDPATSEKDQVRFLISDTNSTDVQLQDEEILWLLEVEPNVYYAAARAAETIAATFTQEVTVSADGMSFSGKDLTSNYLDLADRLRAMAKFRGRMGHPYVGGISHAERDKDDADSDLIKTHFRSGGMDHPQTDSDPLRSDQ